MCWLKPIERRFDFSVDKLKLFDQPFDTFVLVCTSQVKISKKKIFSQIFMKSSIQPNLDIKNSKIELIFPIFSSSFSFLPPLVNNGLKSMSQKFFSQIFMKIST